MTPDLRPYQAEAVDSIRRAVAAGYKRLVLVAPTGAGKSVIAHQIVSQATNKGKRILFVVNRIQLVKQFSKRLSRAGIYHGIIRGADTRAAHAPVVVGSIQTIGRRGVDAFDVIVVDEAHAVPGSKDYRKLFFDNPQSIVIGLTATPWSKGMSRNYDELGGKLFERPVLAAPISKLIADGHLVDCDCWAPTEPDMKGAKTKRTPWGDVDYTDEAAAAAMDKPQIVGDVVDHWFRIAPGSNTVVFASSIQHSLHIVEAFKARGVAAEHISAYTPEEEREQIFRRHANGETTLLSCVALLREGWDAPECSTMILARPTRSEIAYIQMAGRILRPAPGKTKATLIDHTGTVRKLGFPTEDRDYTLDDGKPKVSSSEKKREELKPCPKCGYVDHYKKLLGYRECGQCGFVAQVQPKSPAVADGELALLKSASSKVEKQTVYSELLYVAVERGYSRGWAAHKYRTKFGVWPRGLQDVPIQPRPETLRWIKSQQIRWAKSRRNPSHVEA